jgi:hypothetical protein
MDSALHHFDLAIEMNKEKGMFYYNRAQVKVKLERFEVSL